MSTMDYGRVKLPLREKLFRLMKDMKWHSWEELKNAGGVRYSARLLELKRLGYNIEDQAIGDGSGEKSTD